ncbi:MAG TPA: antitoxin Xre/MbcA/ParS toxin-binding domain-containing protein [Longimicrobium sp.]|nr:antitoxin Xre/MbcA/ParS toxin-binding domain-containing protein [Longimicrobium sp.]
MATKRPGTTPQIQTIEAARERLGLGYGEIAAAIHTQERTLDQWMKGGATPPPIFLDRLNGMAKLLRELERTFADADDARAWLRAPNPSLGQATPRELVAAGEMERVADMLYALNAGIPT